MCCWDDLLIVFWSIFDQFWGRKSIKNRPNIDQKSDQKYDAILDRFWMALGSIFGWFWAQVGGQVGAKLAPKFEKWGFQDKVEKVIVQKPCDEFQSHASNGGSRPLRGSNPGGARARARARARAKAAATRRRDGGPRGWGMRDPGKLKWNPARCSDKRCGGYIYIYVYTMHLLSLYYVLFL